MRRSPQNKNNPGFKVQFARTEKDRDVIRKFRYHVFCVEMGRETVDANHDTKEISSVLDDTAILVMLKLEDRLVGTARVNRGMKRGAFPSDFSETFGLSPFLTDYALKEISLTSSLLIQKDALNSQAMALMLAAIYKMGRQQGTRFEFTSCDAFMVKAYERLGYRRYTGNFVDSSRGLQVPLVLVMEDLEHLQTVGSPFARIAAFFPPDKDPRHWFSRKFADYANRPIEQTMSEEEYWQYLTEKMKQTPLLGIPLLKGLTYQEAKKFVNSGTVITLEDGDTIIRAGEKGDSMFVILAGKVAVKAPEEKGGRTFSTLKSGEIFGELAFLRETPRTADVMAVEPTEVLVLTQAFFQKVMEHIPRIAMRVLFNMCLVLAERLHTSTEDLLTALSTEGSNEVDPADFDDFEAYDAAIMDRYGTTDW